MIAQSIAPLVLVFLLLAFVNSFAQAPAENSETASLPLIKVHGNQFVGPDGQVVIFRGVSFSDPDRLEKVGQWNKAYFQAAADWNANIVRFPVHPRAWRERGVENYLKLLDQGIKWASELGLYVIIDWHSIGNLRTELFQHPMYDTSFRETMKFWKIIADRYKGNSVVAFYEVFNEPTAYGGQLGRLDWAQHKSIMEDIIHLIYAHDRTVIPLVGGLNWAYDLSYVLSDPIAQPGIAYVSHPYPQKREAPWEEKWEADFGAIADRYPIVATEFGFMSADGPGAHIPVIGDTTYGEAIIDYFNQKGISWTAWVFDPLWSPQLIENWQFTPTLQGRFFKRKLMELNKGRK